MITPYQPIQHGHHQRGRVLRNRCSESPIFSPAMYSSSSQPCYLPLWPCFISSWTTTSGVRGTSRLRTRSQGITAIGKSSRRHGDQSRHRRQRERSSWPTTVTMVGAVQQMGDDQVGGASVIDGEVEEAPLRLFNTEGRKKQPFRPQEQRQDAHGLSIAFRPIRYSYILSPVR